MTKTEITITVATVVMLGLLGCSGFQSAKAKANGTGNSQNSDGRLIGLTSTGYIINEVECLGHYYIVVERGGIVHAEHCPCKSK